MIKIAQDHPNACTVTQSDDYDNCGRCCCNCVHRVKIMRHPWNIMVGGRMKGPITEIAGWTCKPDADMEFIFSEREHSMCEMHEWPKETSACAE